MRLERSVRGAIGAAAEEDYEIILSILKADVGSIGGHTKPSQHMMDSVQADAEAAVQSGLLIDAFVGHTGTTSVSWRPTPGEKMIPMCTSSPGAPS